MKEVFYIQKFGNGYLARGLSENNMKINVGLIDVRAAVQPPEAEYPGYYLIMGMKNEPNQYGKYPLMFVAEKAEPTFDGLLEFFADDSSRTKVSTVYCPRPVKIKNTQGFFKDLWNFRYQQGLPFQVKPAISVQDYIYGKALLEEWTVEKSLIRPMFADTILSQQIASDDGLNEESDISEPRWFAFHALRYLISGFIKFPPDTVKRRSSTGWGDRYDSENILSYQGVKKPGLKGWGA